MTTSEIADPSVPRRAKGDGATSVRLFPQIVSVLREEILRGVFPVGTQLPAENALAARFKVSRHTIREALRELRGDGLIASRQGSGSVVEGAPTDQSYVQEVGSINDLIHQAPSVIFRVDSSKIITASEQLAQELDIPAASRWLQMQGFRYVKEGDAAPTCWTEIFVHPDYAGVARIQGRTPRAVYELIEDLYAVKVNLVDQQLSGQPMPAELVGPLGVSKTATAINILRKYFLTSGKIIEVARTLYPAERFRYSMRISRKLHKNVRLSV